MLSYRQLNATSVISSQRFHPNIMRGSALSYTLYTMIYLIFQKRTINVHFYVFEWQANITLKFGKLRPDYHHDTYKVLLRQQGQIRARV